jgi:hypothetical protein
MVGITEVGTLATEIVLSERRVSTEFKITEIHEQVQNRVVRAEVELGPFVTEEGPAGNAQTRGASRRGVTVWQNEEYDAIRDTWTNADLIAAVTARLND